MNVADRDGPQPCKSVRGGQDAHPAPQQLEAFLHSGGELPRSEAVAVVRHLLMGCPRCVGVTRRSWFGERPPAPEPRSMQLVKSEAHRQAGAATKEALRIDCRNREEP